MGRARQKYPSISKYYVIDYIPDDVENPKNMADIQWRIAVPENVDKDCGIIVRIMSTQKAVTTEGANALGEKVYMRLCSEPTKAAEDIYDKLKYKKMPFRKIKIKESL